MSTEFQFSVPINNLTQFNSPEFEAGGVSWKFIIIRKISNEKFQANDFIHVSLFCEYEASRQTWTGWWIEATALLTLISNKDNNLTLQKTISPTRLGKNHSMVELKDFISWNDLNTERNGFIKDGHFLLQVNFASTHVQKRITFCEVKNETTEIEPKFSAVQNEKKQKPKKKSKKSKKLSV